MFLHHFHILKRKKKCTLTAWPQDQSVLPARLKKKKKMVLRVQPSSCHWPWVSPEKLINTSVLPPHPPCSPRLHHLADLPFPPNTSFFLHPLPWGGWRHLPVLRDENGLRQHPGPWISKIWKEITQITSPTLTNNALFHKGNLKHLFSSVQGNG